VRAFIKGASDYPADEATTSPAAFNVGFITSGSVKKCVSYR